MKRRSRHKRSILKRGLILCEGETEQNYFKGLVSDTFHRDKFASISVDIYKPRDHSPVGLVDEAKNKIKTAKRDRNEFDFVWVVFDKDGHQNLPKAFSDARTYSSTIHIAFTAICFEYFILLHFERTTSPYRRCDDLIKRLKSHISDYEKAANLYSVLKDRIDYGIANSEWAYNQAKSQIDSGRMPHEMSSFSNVHKLVSFLYSL